ncbi:MAG: hypothetical protein KAT88_09935, partial [Spirochaetes bacterium]|nr:hypothetical protein [Spirochaetota bacterium]
MKYSSREKFSNYFDLFILFIEFDIFIWILFELSYTFRPIVYDVGRILIIIYIFELIVRFLLNPVPITYIKRCWHLYVSAAVLFFLFYRFSSIPQSHRFIFLYSKLFLGTVEVIIFTKFVFQIDR